MKKRLLPLLALAALVVPAAASAQSATINATATVVAPVAVTPGNDLLFGNVAPGFTSSVTPASGNAGTFAIVGGGDVEVSLTFTLPANLADGTNNLPISFGPADAGYAATAAGPLTTFDPTSPSTANLVAGALFVAIGGTVDATAAPSGSYSGTISLAVAYTGT